MGDKRVRVRGRGRRGCARRMRVRAAGADGRRMRARTVQMRGARRGRWRNGGCGTNGRRVGHRGGCGADGSRRAKSKAAVRQPCSLSTFDSLKPMQSCFFGSRGLFPKKVLESGCGVNPRIYTFPHVGVRGAQPREIVPPAGREAPRIYSFFTTTVSSPSRRAKYSSSPTVAPYTSDE